MPLDANIDSYLFDFELDQTVLCAIVAEPRIHTFQDPHEPGRLSEEEEVLRENKASEIPGLCEKGEVVQVTLEPAFPMNVGVLISLLTSQEEISRLIKRVIVTHRVKPFPPRTFFRGEGYTLEAKHSPWPFGERWDFGWGEVKLRPSAEKWTFIFAPDDYLN